MAGTNYADRLAMDALPEKVKAVAFTAKRQTALVDWEFDHSPLQPNEVVGRTLVTVVSPGMEVNGYFEDPRDKPEVGGYAAIIEVTALGQAVKDVRIGEHVFCMGRHAAWQRFPRAEVVPVPEGLKPQSAVFCRLMGVSWATLVTTKARPADRVVVTGLGLVGNLAAQIFQSAGYRVTAVDPLEGRRKLALHAGVKDVRESAGNDAKLAGRVKLAIECSGHEQAVLDCCRLVAKGGEVSMVGAPWKRRTDVMAFDLLKEIFNRYVILRSGWEWELPRREADFREGSTFGDFASALRWLADGRINVDGLYRMVRPHDSQWVYEQLAQHGGDELTVQFDWRNM